jgi:competence protein ComEA
LNDAMPPWRSFPAEAPGPAAPAATGRAVPRWTAAVLAVVGGLCAGMAVLAAAVLAWNALPQAEAALPFAETEPAAIVPAAGAMTEAAPSLVVDVAGAVVDPGLHRLQPGDRVGDAIEAAGGFAPRADLAAASASLNLARPLEDGAKVWVPELGIDRPATAGAASVDGRIDLNGATSAELEALPGIGPVTAGKIIAAREDQRFGAVRELRSRGLVGEKVYEDVKDLVRAG